MAVAHMRQQIGLQDTCSAANHFILYLHTFHIKEGIAVTPLLWSFGPPHLLHVHNKYLCRLAAVKIRYQERPLPGIYYEHGAGVEDLKVRSAVVVPINPNDHWSYLGA